MPANLSRRRNQVLTIDFRMPHLFRDDLEEIERVMKEELKPRIFKIETADYEFSAVDQIPHGSEPETDLTITTHSPHISIALSGHSARLFCTDSIDLNAVGAAKRVEAIIRRRERHWRSIFCGFWIGFAGSLILGALPWFALKFSQGRLSLLHLGVLAAVVVVFNLGWGIVSFRATTSSFSRIEFIERRSSRSFWQRKKDDLIADFLKVICGAVVGYLIASLSAK